jgi:N-sulfoglucosamine sulfohydrolase
MNSGKRQHVIHSSVMLLAMAWAGCFMCPLTRNYARADERPNILFCLADDWSYPHAGAYSCTWVRTPGFDRVAKEGLLFTRAYTPNAKCAPSRSIILTGRNSWQLGEACNHNCEFPPDLKVVTEVLEEHGYFVGKTGKGWGPGRARDANGQPRPLLGKSFDTRTTKPPTSAISRNDYAANFQDFLAEKPHDRPWFFWYGSTEPHRAYEFQSGIKLTGKSLADVKWVPPYWPDNEVVRTDLLDYALEVEYFDHHLQKMLELLEQSGELDNTIVIVTSDNGMPFPRMKGQCYELSNHMPLAIMWKRGIAHPGRVIEDFVSFADFAPTFLELAGVEWEKSGMADFAGRSLMNILKSDRSGQVDPSRTFVLVGKERHDVGRPHDWGYPIRGIREGPWLYLRNYEPTRWPAGNPETGYLNCDGSPTKTEILHARRENRNLANWQACFGKRPPEELYNVVEDPECHHNLIQQHADVAHSLSQKMTELLRQEQDPRMFGQGDIFEKYPYIDPKTQNFYERFMAGEKISAGWVNPDDFESAPITDE